MILWSKLLCKYISLWPNSMPNFKNLCHWIKVIIIITEGNFRIVLSSMFGTLGVSSVLHQYVRRYLPFCGESPYDGISLGYCGWCLVLWSALKDQHVQYCGGHHQYIRGWGFSLLCRDTIVAVEDIQYFGGIPWIPLALKLLLATNGTSSRTGSDTLLSPTVLKLMVTLKPYSTKHPPMYSCYPSTVLMISLHSTLAWEALLKGNHCLRTIGQLGTMLRTIWF